MVVVVVVVVVVTTMGGVIRQFQNLNFNTAAWAEQRQPAASRLIMIY